MQRALVGVERGAPGALVLTGEPGIGKSRLLGELAARADASLSRVRLSAGGG
jgi:MoxR-like ATPase